MSSSTSSFRRVPPTTRGPWPIVAAGFLVVLLLGGADTFLRSRNVRFALKTPLTWARTLRALPKESESKILLFYGSSRVNLGFSPADFDSQVKKLGGSIRSVNLGLDGHAAGIGIVAHRDLMPACDVLMVDVMPMAPRNPGQDREWKELKSASVLSVASDALGAWIDRTFAFPSFQRALRNFNETLAVRRSRLHDDGWQEVNYDLGSDALKRDLAHRVEQASSDMPDPEIVRASLRQFAGDLREIQARQHCRLVLVRMPVGYAVRQVENAKFAKLNVFGILREELPMALIIDANEEPVLRNYQAVEGSHLDGSQAARFSMDLATIIYKWLAAEDTTYARRPAG